MWWTRDGTPALRFTSAFDATHDGMGKVKCFFLEEA